MVLWNFDLRRKKNIWTITKHNKTLIYNGKNYGNISKQLKFKNLFTALEIQFTMDITMVLWKKNFGTRFHAKRFLELSLFVQRWSYSRSPLRC